MFIFITYSSLARFYLPVFALCSGVSVVNCQHVREMDLQQTFSEELTSQG